MAILVAWFPLPITLIYPLLHNYVLLVGYALIWVLGRGMGFYKTAEDLGLHFLNDPTLFVLLSRFMSVLMGVAIVILVLRIGRLLFSETIGRIAAFLAAVNFLLIQISQWALPDALLVFCTTSGFYLLFLGLKEGRPRFLYCPHCLPRTA